MSLPAETARTIGTLGGDPVLALTLDCAHHPLRPLTDMQLNSPTRWVGWRGKWAEARGNTAHRLANADPRLAPEVVWRDLTEPPHDVPPYPPEFPW